MREPPSNGGNGRARPPSGNGKPLLPKPLLPLPEDLVVKPTRHGGPKIDDAILEAFEVALSTNFNIRAALRLTGITSASFYHWRNKGRDGIEPYVRFFEMINRAKVEFERRRLETIIEATREQVETTTTVKKSPDGETTTKKVVQGPGDWRAAAWLLERKLPAEYAPKNETKLSGTVTLAAALTKLRDAGKEAKEARRELPEPEGDPR